ncbi:MFS transporter [Actinoplanes sp. NPDC023801]|uniref:MFS transporter n=1 Tax=Actinoplanes sp. NPDC023801 TaxID=3154595 RepID=UPI0034045D1D
MRAVLADRRPLRIPAYRRWWVASLVTAVGGSFSVVAVPAQLYATTGSSAAIGGAAVVSFAGLLTGALGAGTLADRHDRRGVLLAAQLVLAVTYLGLWAHAEFGGPLGVLLALVAGQGLTFGAISTVAGAVLPRLVPTELLAAANSLNSLVRYGGSILGPILAGLLIPVAGLKTLYLCDAVALLAVLWAVFRLPSLRPEPQPAPSDAVRSRPRSADPDAVRRESQSSTDSDAVEPVSRPADSDAVRPADSDAVEPEFRRAGAGSVRFGGFRYLLASPLLVAVLAVDLSAMVFGMPVALFPELARHTYGDPAGGGPMLGLLYAAYPVGVFLAGLFSGTFTRARHPGRMMAGAAIAWGGTVVLFGLAGHIALALTALVLGGGVNFILSTHRNAITQAHTDDAVRGRVQGMVTVVLFGGPQLANLVHGTAGALIGPRPAIIVGGLLTMIAVAAVLGATPALRELETVSPRQGALETVPARQEALRTVSPREGPLGTASLRHDALEIASTREEALETAVTRPERGARR